MISIDRDRFINEMNKCNIGVSLHFVPFHLHPFYQRKFGYKKGDFPNADYVYDRIFSLPFYPRMQKKDYDYIVKTVKYLISKYKK